MKESIAFKFSIALAVVFSFAMSFYITTRSWEGRVYIARDRGLRRVAALQGSGGVPLEGLSFKVVSTENLIKGAVVEKSERGIGIQLGNFLIRGFEGERKKFVCEIYDKVNVIFMANDMMVEGEPCLMIVESNCFSAEDPQYLIEMFIPFTEISREHPMARSWKVEDSEASTSVTMKNIIDTWPREWVLYSINFIHSHDLKQRLSFNQEELRDLSRKSIEFSWP